MLDLAHTGLRSSASPDLVTRKSMENYNVSNPAQGMKGGKAERAIHTDSLLKGQHRMNG